MKIKFLDKLTGATAWDEGPCSVYWYAHGNGACDCNRELIFDPTLIDSETPCNQGDYRYIAIDLADSNEVSLEKELYQHYFDTGYYIDKQMALDLINYN